MDERSLRAIFLSAIRTASAGAVLSSCAAPEPMKLSPVTDATSAPPNAALVVAPSSLPTGLANKSIDCSQGPFHVIMPDGTKRALDYLQIEVEQGYIAEFGKWCDSATDKPRCKIEVMALKERLSYANRMATVKYDSIVTAQDTVSTIAPSDIARLRLSNISSPVEAALHVSLKHGAFEYEGYALKSCPNSSGETREGYVLSYNFDGLYSGGFEEILVTFGGEIRLLAFDKPSMASLGRRPEGLCAPTRREPKSAGEFFAESAWQEAVSVPAFHTLARDLALLNAPPSLIEAALVAAQDERRHEQQMTALAHLEGEQVAVPRVEEVPPKDLFALALENEREGCVNEAFAALLAWHQAEHAQDPRLASEMRAIAADETSHAALAFKIQQWLWPQLSPAQQEATRRVRQQTIAARRARPQELPEEVARRLGWPSREQAAALLELVADPLWS